MPHTHANAIFMLSDDVLVKLVEACAAHDVFQLASVNTLFQKLTGPKREQIKKVIDELDECGDVYTSLNDPLDIVEYHFTNFSLSKKGFSAFSAAAMTGVMWNLEELQHGLINDDRMVTFSEVITSGLLPKLKTLDLSYHHLTYKGIDAFASAIGNGALESLTDLSLATTLGMRDTMGDAGMIALANAIKPTPENPIGSLRKLEILYVYGNKIGASGAIALADAIDSKALPSLRTLCIDNSRLTQHPQLKVACAARGIKLH